jgi:hypothetical protein
LRASRSRWFVQEQQSGAAQEQLRERDPHLPPARERLRLLVEVLQGEAQAAQHRRDLQVDAVALLPPEALLQIRVSRQHLRVGGLVGRIVREPILERGDLVAHVEEGLEGVARLLAQRAAGVMQAVLRQVADGQTRGLDHAAAVGLFETRQHLEERRLAGAVGAGEAHALAVVDLPAHRVEQHTAAKRLAQRRELNHSERRDRAEGARIRQTKRAILAQPAHRVPARPRHTSALVRGTPASATNVVSYRVLFCR